MGIGAASGSVLTERQEPSWRGVGLVHLPTDGRHRRPQRAGGPRHRGHEGHRRGASPTVSPRPAPPWSSAARTTPSRLAARVRGRATCATPTQVAALVERHRGRARPLDIAVNNAGGSPTADAADASPRFSEAIIRLNLLAPLHVAQAANRVMQEQDSGGVDRQRGQRQRAAPLARHRRLRRRQGGPAQPHPALAVEWAPKVRVNAVSAGLVATEDSLDHYGGAEGLARVAATVPSGRFARARRRRRRRGVPRQPLGGLRHRRQPRAPRRRRVARVPRAPPRAAGAQPTGSR